MRCGSSTRQRVKACRKLDSWWQNLGISGGSESALCASAGTDWDLLVEGASVPEIGSALTSRSRKGVWCWTKRVLGFAACGTTGGVCRLWYRVYVDQTRWHRLWLSRPPSTGALPWLKLGDTASTVSPPRVEDAGNGYSTPSWPFAGCGVLAQHLVKLGHGGWKGESLKPRSWASGGCS
jgi:hypothetical protein